MSSKDVVMMIVAFLIGLIIVSVLFGGKPQPQPKQPGPAPRAALQEAAGMPQGELVGLDSGYFLYHSPQDRFFLCRLNQGRLEVVDVYKLRRTEPTYFAGISEGAAHGWSFVSLSREKDAVLEAKRKQFEKVVISRDVNEQDWEKARELAGEIAAVGGIEFLKGWLGPQRDWAGRRAAAIALAKRGYIETVPVLADMLLEGPQARELAAKWLVKLTGEDFFEKPKSASTEKVLGRYKDWYNEHAKEKR